MLNMQTWMIAGSYRVFQKSDCESLSCSDHLRFFSSFNSFINFSHLHVMIHTIQMCIDIIIHDIFTKMCTLIM